MNSLVCFYTTLFNSIDSSEIKLFYNQNSKVFFFILDNKLKWRKSSKLQITSIYAIYKTCPRSTSMLGKHFSLKSFLHWLIWLYLLTKAGREWYRAKNFWISMMIACDK